MGWLDYRGGVVRRLGSGLFGFGLCVCVCVCVCVFFWVGRASFYQAAVRLFVREVSEKRYPNPCPCRWLKPLDGCVCLWWWW